MISPSGSMLLAGGIAVGGQWAKGNKLPARTVIGIGFTSVVIAIIAEANPEFGSQFALLILVAVLFVYGPPIAKKLGLIR